jgi:hypothetical protein
MTKPIIQYPRGSGGNWLGNLIWHLEHNQLSLPNVDVVFDGQLRSNSFAYTHVFNLLNGKNPTFDQYPGPRVIFSSPCWFNQFINDAVKVRYHIQKLSKESIADQFFLLSNSAVYILTDQLWQTTWEIPGELEYRLLSEDQERFIDCLFSLLDKFNIKYTSDRNYCRASIEYYKSTCPKPLEHLNNFDSLLWLSWCHAHILINKQSLSASITPDATINSIRNIIEPVSSEVLATTLPMVAS